MSEFDTNFSELCEPALMEHNGRTIDYVEPDDSETSLTAMVGNEESRDEGDLDGRRWVRVRSVVISLDDFASPTPDGRVKIDSELWAIQTVEGKSGNLARLSVTRPERIETSRPAYRRGG